MNEPNGRLRLSWQQIAWAVSLLLAIGAAWMDLRIQVTRSEDRAGRIEDKIDRMRLDLDQAQQNNNFVHEKLDGRVRTLEMRRR